MRNVNLEEWKSRVRFFWNLFCMNTTCMVLVVGVMDCFVYENMTVTVDLFWQILLIAAVNAMSSFIFPWHRVMSRVEMVIRVLIHYVIITITVMLGGYWFQWYNVHKWKSVLFMFLTITVVYAVISYNAWTRSIQDVKNLNEKLRELQREDEK